MRVETSLDFLKLWCPVASELEICSHERQRKHLHRTLDRWGSEEGTVRVAGRQQGTSDRSWSSRCPERMNQVLSPRQERPGGRVRSMQWGTQHGEPTSWLDPAPRQPRAKRRQTEHRKKGRAGLPRCCVPASSMLHSWWPGLKTSLNVIIGPAPCQSVRIFLTEHRESTHDVKRNKGDKCRIHSSPINKVSEEGRLWADRAFGSQHASEMIKRTCWIEQGSFTDQGCRNPETESKVGTKEAERMANCGDDVEQGWGKLSQAPQGQPKGTESYRALKWLSSENNTPLCAFN